MPCSDGDYGRREYNAEQRRLAEHRLCYVMSSLERLDQEMLERIVGSNPGLKVWWDQHKREDQERLDREAAQLEMLKLRNIAISKLTLAERAALGLNRG